jgi:hypothetical protein
MADQEIFFADPLVTLREVFAREERRYEDRREDMAQMRNALLQLAASPTQAGQESPVWEPVAADVAPPLIRHLVASTTTTIRSSIVQLEVGPGSEPETLADAQVRLARGDYELRTLYPQAVMDDAAGRAYVAAWAEAGEQQRLSLSPPSDFAVFGTYAVMAVARWADAHADYVLIREPMVVQAFAALFDYAFEKGLPVPREDRVVDEQFLGLMARGVKDESIARYLGCSLRTVRRRVSRLMEDHGVETRFQLGAAMAREGLVAQELRPPGT